MRECTECGHQTCSHLAEYEAGLLVAREEAYNEILALRKTMSDMLHEYDAMHKMMVAKGLIPPTLNAKNRERWGGLING